MRHYVAIVEDSGPDKAVGIWFPDLPGCFSAGDDVDEALHNAEEALALYAEAEAKLGRAVPLARTLSALRSDPSAASDLREHMVALVPLKDMSAHAAVLDPDRVADFRCYSGARSNGIRDRHDRDGARA